MCVCVRAEAEGGIKSQHTQSYSLSCSESHCLISLSRTHLKTLAHGGDTHTHTHSLQLSSRENKSIFDQTGRKKKKKKKNWKFVCLFFLGDFELGHEDLEKKFFFLFTGGYKLSPNSWVGQTKQRGILFFLIYCWTFGLLDWARAQ